MDTPSSAAEDLVRAAGALSRWASTQAGLGAPSGVFRLLAIVEERGPIRIGDLAHADQTSQPAVTRQVGRLESRGWVERDADPDDARAILVAITPSGRAALEKARRSRGEALTRIMDAAGVAESRVRDAADLLEQLLQAASAAAGKE
ncbi:MAG: MarR family transcriptional regulator [Micropruina sp.]|uniref:MarR family winged helix-turn-helix transcriptional regulator n=1 Tax=Micropruina sp. TaxID=2737536 RepID=UPI0039E52E7A